MTLSDYLTCERIKPSQFAAMIGVPASTITRILSEGRMPRRETLNKIIEATGSAVMPNDFAQVEAKQPEAAQ